MLHVAIRGRVQGVGFRWFVRERARELGISGWVRNMGDDSVEVAAMGTHSSLDQLHTFLQEGPPGARVSAIDVLDGAPDTPLTNGFVILR